MRERFTLVEIPSEVEQGLEDKGVAVEIRPLDPSRTGKMTKLARLRLQVERNERRIALKLAPAELKKKMAGPFSRLISRLTSEKSLMKKRKALERKMAPKDGSLPEAWLDLYSDSVFRDSVYPREMMEGDRTLSFHGREFPVPQDIEGYLRLVYGDYRNRDWEAMPDESLLPYRTLLYCDQWTSLSPTIPIRISVRKRRRKIFAESWKNKMPINTVPIAPIPVQMT